MWYCMCVCVIYDVGNNYYRQSRPEFVSRRVYNNIKLLFTGLKSNTRERYIIYYYVTSVLCACVATSCRHGLCSILSTDLVALSPRADHRSDTDQSRIKRAMVFRSMNTYYHLSLFWLMSESIARRKEVFNYQILYTGIHYIYLYMHH
jgi:hypothetical protein